MWFLFLACQQQEKTEDTSISVEATAPVEPSTEEDTGTADSEDTDDSDSNGDASEEESEANTDLNPERKEGEYIRVTGEITWTLTFDEEAKENGFFDCSYRRTYEGEERIDRKYLCPDCGFMAQGTATMEEGLDCHGQISSSNAEQRTKAFALLLPAETGSQINGIQS